MSAEIKELMERIDPTHEKILLLSQKCQEFIHIYPNQAQKLVDMWSKIIEISNQKLALLFLCNDILQNSPSESLRSLFQFSLSRAFSIACNDVSSVTDIRKLLKVWGDCQLFPRQVLEDWERICLRAEQLGSKSDRSNYLHIISVGKKLRNLKNSCENVLHYTGEEKIKALEEEHKAREDLIKEIVICMKKVYHGHLNITICLQRINEKLFNLEKTHN
jgi:CID domain